MAYLRNLVNKTESIVQCMRWKAHFFLQNNRDDNTYSLKSKHGVPSVLNLKPFEHDIAKIIELAKFQNISNNFIQTLELDKRIINASSNVFIPVDETWNFYEMDSSTYNKLLTENVTKTYKHASDDTKLEIKELKSITSELKITNSIDCMNETPAFISLKDYKPDFENHPKCPLINPAKSSLGKVSKSI